MYPFHYAFTNADTKGPFDSPFDNVDFVTGDDQERYSVVQKPPESTFMTAYRDLLNQSKGPATKAYEEYLNSGNIPKREPLGKWGRLGAILSGAVAGWAGGPAAGIKVGRDVAEYPYRQRIEDYALEGEQLKSAAGLEQSDYKRQLDHYKAIADYENVLADNLRLDRSTDASIRNINDQINNRKSQNWTVVESKIDGTKSLVKVMPDGTKQVVNLGKVSESEAERRRNDIEADVTKAVRLEPIHAKGDVRRAGLARGNAIAVQDRIDDRANADRNARGNTESELNRERLARAAVDAIVKADPNRYQDMWVAGANGYGDLVVPEDFKGPADPRYPDYVRLYNALNQGLLAPEDIQLPWGTIRKGQPLQLSMPTPNGNVRY